MRRIKKLCSVCVTGFMLLSAFSGFSVQAASEPGLIGSKLDSRSYTDMPLESGNSEMNKLNDGTMDGAVAVKMKKDVDMSDGKYFVDIVCNGFIAKYQSLDLGCNVGLIKDQSIKKIGVAGYNDETNTWPSGPQQTYDITWLKSGDSYTGKAVVNFDTPITSSRLRVYILDANRTWDNFRMEELAAYGELTGKGIDSLTRNASVTTNFTCEGNFPLSNLTDRYFASEMLTNFNATPENPGIITMDFGDKYYDFDRMDMVGLFAKNAGVTAMTIEYKNGGEWTKLKDVTFNRSGRNGSDGSQIDRIDLGVVTNGLQFKVTEHKNSWGHFRISEIALYGPSLVGDKLDARSCTDMPLEGDNTNMDKLNDGTMDGAVVVSLDKNIDMSDGKYYLDIICNGYIAKYQSLDLGCNTGLIKHQDIKKIGIAGYDDETHTWPSGPQQVYDVVWPEKDGKYTGKAVIKFKTPITSSRLRVYILDANRTWNNFRMEELAAYGKLAGNSVDSLAQNAAVTTNFTCEGNFPLGNLTDRYFASEMLTNFKATPENPGIITMDFGDKYYDFENMDMVGMHAKNAGVTAMTIEYKNGGEWTKLKDLTFNRSGRYGSTDLQIDRIDLGVTGNGLRFNVTDYNKGYGHFRISDMLIYGNESYIPAVNSANISYTVNGNEGTNNQFGSGTINVSADITLEDGRNGAVLYAALYSGEKMIAVVQSEKTDGGAVNCTFDVDNADGKTIKLLVLDSVLSPICNAVELQPHSN